MYYDYNQKKIKIANYYVVFALISLAFMLLINPVLRVIEFAEYGLAAKECISIFFNDFFTAFRRFEFFVYAIGLIFALVTKRNRDSGGAKYAFLIIIGVSVVLMLAESLVQLTNALDMMFGVGAASDSAVEYLCKAIIGLTVTIVYITVSEFASVAVREIKELVGTDKRNY